MSTLIITRGIPASGKTTWAKEWVAEDPKRRVRVNRDDFRAMCFNAAGVLDRELEDAVQVVDMWRDELGLTVFQVARGAF